MNYLSISPDVKLGTDVKLSKFINLYGCSVGDETKIGAFVEIQKNAVVGSRCKIQSHTFICEGVAIGNNCFIGHGVIFINDKYPTATNPDGSMQTDEHWEVIPTVVDDFVTIGSGATIMCGVHIGKGSIIGAASMVTCDVPPGEIWAGNPARLLRKREEV